MKEKEIKELRKRVETKGIEETLKDDIKRYKRYQQELKTSLVQLIIKINRTVLAGIKKKELNEYKDNLESEIEIVELIIETYEIRSKVKKLDSEHKELIAKDREGEFVSDLLKSNRYEFELLSKKDKKNSNIIIELMTELGKKRKKYRDQLLKNEFEVGTKVLRMADKARKNLEEIIKFEEEYKVLLERKKIGESVKDLIKQNRYHTKVLAKKDIANIKEAKRWQQSKEGKKWLKDTEVRSDARRLFLSFQAVDKLGQLSDIYKKILENETEYKSLSQRKQSGENVDGLITQNRDYAEVLINNYIINSEEKEEWKRSNPDLFKNPKDVQNFLAPFRLSQDKNEEESSQSKTTPSYPPISELIQKKKPTKDKSIEEEEPE